MLDRDDFIEASPFSRRNFPATLGVTYGTLTIS